MAGIYIHIPFCKRACNYCNFHFSTSFKLKNPLLETLRQELADRASELENQTVETIYFGGGTPSVLSAEELQPIFEQISKHYQLAPKLEITLEANPDDLSLSYLQSLQNQTPINRLSIGLQSLVEEDLRFMKRAHNAQEARQSVDDALGLGFNLSVDFIYGSPFLSDEAWVENLRFVFDRKIPHLSCYALTVEEKTALFFDIKSKKSPALEEEKAARQFEILLAETAKNGYEQYEISNFCRPPAYAQHNTGYWQGKPYIGIGAGAHSFDGQKRRWNIANNALYINNLANKIPYWEEEILSAKDIFNEYLLTSLRTRWGAERGRLLGLLQQTQQNERQFWAKIADLEAKNWIINDSQTLRLSDAGKLLADQIISDLFAD